LPECAAPRATSLFHYISLDRYLAGQAYVRATGLRQPKGSRLSSHAQNNSFCLLLVSIRPALGIFWDTQPVRSLRKYLNDRHDRRKDHEYRESAEQRRLALENLSLETRVISERVQLAKGIGATDRDLAPLLNELIYKPLVALDRYQDKGVIEHTEIPSDPSPSEDKQA